MSTLDGCSRAMRSVAFLRVLILLGIPARFASEGALASGTRLASYEPDQDRDQEHESD
jgi:hypothetical protein